MPSFDLIDKVELFVRTGTFQVGASKSSKKVTRAASKHFIYKGISETGTDTQKFITDRCVKKLDTNSVCMVERKHRKSAEFRSNFIKDHNNQSVGRIAH